MKYKYIDKLPELARGYFEHGHQVEEKYCNAIDGYKLDGTHPERTNSDFDLDAKALFELETLKNDLFFFPFQFQKTYKQCRCKKCGGWSNIDKEAWEFEKCDHCGTCEFEDWALIGVLDIFVDGGTRDWDIKTAGQEWTQENLKEIKRQAMIYRHFTGKDLWFAVANKKNHTAKVFPTRVENLDSLWVRCEELALAFELEQFEATPSFKCKFCNFSKFCEFSYSK